MKSPSEAAFDPYHLWLQIPKDSRPPTHYQLLGLAVGEADPEVIRQATLMRSAYVRHFQAGANADDANRVLEELAEASRVLQDPALRAAYEAKVKPAAKPAAKPAVAANSKPVVIPAPKQPVEDYEVVDRADRRPRTKRSKRKSRSSFVSNIVGIVLLGASLGVVGYLINVYNRSSSGPVAKSESKPKDDGKPSDANQLTPTPVPDSSKGAEPGPRPIGALIVRLSVDPPDARLTLEPIGDSTPGGPKASIEGIGGDRTIVAEKGSLPLVIAASATGYQSNRITVFSSDAGRLVVVQLQKGSGRNLIAGGSGPASKSGSDFGYNRVRKTRRPVGTYRVGIPNATKDQKPVWKYTVNRPGPEWAAITFGDVLWNEGEGAFGTKTGKNAVKLPGLWLRTAWASRDIWMRARIDLPAEVKGATIRWTYRNDNSLQVLVNGTHQFVDERPNLQITSKVIETSAFVPGPNVVAVHCSNTRGPGLVDVGFEWIEMEDVK